METKYNGEVNINVYKEFLVKRIFKLLPLREEKKNWEKYLEVEAFLKISTF